MLIDAESCHSVTVTSKYFFVFSHGHLFEISIGVIHKVWCLAQSHNSIENQLFIINVNVKSIKNVITILQLFDFTIWCFNLEVSLLYTQYTCRDLMTKHFLNKETFWNNASVVFWVRCIISKKNFPSDNSS